MSAGYTHRCNDTVQERSLSTESSSEEETREKQSRMCVLAEAERGGSLHDACRVRSYARGGGDHRVAKLLLEWVDGRLQVLDLHDKELLLIGELFIYRRKESSANGH